MARADTLERTLYDFYRSLSVAAATAAPSVAAGLPVPVSFANAAPIWPRLVTHLAWHAHTGWGDVHKDRRPRPSPSVIRREAVAVAERQGARLVTAETDRVKARIADLVADAMSDMSRWPARLTSGIRFAPGSSYGTEPFTAWLARHVEPMIGLNRRQEATVARYRRRLIRDLAEGLAGRRDLPRRISTLADVARAVAQYSDQLRQQRARLIAATESHAALQAGRRAAYEEMAQNGRAPIMSLLRWVLVDDDRLCDECEALDGAEVHVVGGVFTTDDGDSLPTPPLHPNCVTADTRISIPGGSIIGGYRSRLNGPLIQITVGGGQRLEITPNHPVATPNGWVPAGRLREGDDVILARQGNRDSCGRPRDVQVQRTIAEIVDSLGESAQMTTTRVPSASEQFHGDAAAYEQIDVIRPYSALEPDGQTTAAETFGKILLGGRGVTPGPFLADRLSAQLVVTSGSSACRCVSCGDHLVTGRLIRVRPPLEHRVASTSRGDPLLHETTADHYAFNVERPRESEFRVPCPVPGGDFVVGKIDTPRHLRSVRCVVYNLETTTGYYMAGDSGVIVSNCRCVVQLVS